VAPRLKRLSARDVLRALARFGFEVARTKGSHAKLVHVTSDGDREILTVPLHKQLDLGTLRAIYRQAIRFIPERELRPYFYDN